LNVNQLIERAEAIIEEKYPSDKWRGFINSILDDLTPAAKVLKTADVTVTLASGAGEFTISDEISNVFEIVSVSFTPTGKRSIPLRKLFPHDNVSTGWKQQEDKIVLQSLPWSAGTANVSYYERLTLTSSNGVYTMSLPEKYHEVVLKGVLAVAMQKEEEIDRKQDFFGEYLLAKRNMAVERITEVEPWNKQFVLGEKLGLGGGK